MSSLVVDLLAAYAAAAEGARANDPGAPGVEALVETARAVRERGPVGPRSSAVERALAAAWLIEEGLRLDHVGVTEKDRSAEHRGAALLVAAQALLVGRHVGETS